MDLRYKIVLGAVVFVMIYINITVTIWGQEDYGEIQSVIDTIYEDEEINFTQLMDEIKAGKIKSPDKMLEKYISYVANELYGYKRTLIILFISALISGIGASFFSSPRSNIKTEAGMYVAYLFVSITVLGIYKEMFGVAKNSIESINKFVFVLIPSYTAVTAFSTGSMSATGYYTFTYILISAINTLVLKVVLPLSGIYILISIADDISMEGQFTKLRNLAKKTAVFILKSLVILVSGVSLIQRMILPYKDAVRRQALFQASRSMPVVGNMFVGLNEIVFSSGLLVKNSMGVAAIVVIISLIVVPLIKVLMGIGVLRLAAAITEPVGNKKISEGIEAGADAMELLFMSIVVCSGLFIISIALTCGG